MFKIIFRGIVHSLVSSEDIFYIQSSSYSDERYKKNIYIYKTAAVANLMYEESDYSLAGYVRSDMFLHDGTYAHVQLQDDIYRVVTASNHSPILQPVTKQVSVCGRVCSENILTAPSIDQPLLRAYETRTRKLVRSSVLISTLATPV